MAISKCVMYSCDDGKTYPNIEQARSAQTKWRKEKTAQEAYRKQANSLYKVLGTISQNTSTNTLLVQELLLKPSVAIEFRDKLNKVVDYHRRKKGAK